jgi:hypothetical protein
MFSPDKNMENLNLQENQLISFLRDLANNVKEKKLNNEQLDNIGDFFMSYQFQEQARKDNDESELADVHYTSSELLKFMSMGLYIYRRIKLEQTL